MAALLVAVIGFGKPVEPLEWMIVIGRRYSSSHFNTGSHRVFSGYKERAADPKTLGEGWLMIVTELGLLKYVRAAVAEGSSTSCTIMWVAFVTVNRWAIAGGELFGDKKSTPVEGLVKSEPNCHVLCTNSIPFDKAPTR
jgi:hypothetical protein